MVLIAGYICRVFISCSKLASSKSQTIQQTVSNYISEALDHAPSLVVLDDLDSIISSPNNSEDHQSSSSSTALMEFLTGILDEYEVRFSIIVLKHYLSCV